MTLNSRKWFKLILILIFRNFLSIWLFVTLCCIPNHHQEEEEAATTKQHLQMN